MRAINFEDIKVGHKVVIESKKNLGNYHFTIAEVRGIEKSDRSIISNIGGGLNIYPNEDDQYIVIDKN